MRHAKGKLLLGWMVVSLVGAMGGRGAAQNGAPPVNRSAIALPQSAWASIANELGNASLKGVATGNAVIQVAPAGTPHRLEAQSTATVDGKIDPQGNNLLKSLEQGTLVKTGDNNYTVRAYVPISGKLSYTSEALGKGHAQFKTYADLVLSGELQDDQFTIKGIRYQGPKPQYLEIKGGENVILNQPAQNAIDRALDVYCKATTEQKQASETSNPNSGRTGATTTRSSSTAPAPAPVRSRAALSAAPR